MKDYKKIYKTLIKQIKYIRNDEKSNKSLEPNKRLRLLDEIESRYAISVLDHLLDVVEEVEGKKHHNIHLNEHEYKLWKKEIKK